jgi:hypothetical protein
LLGLLLMRRKPPDLHSSELRLFRGHRLPVFAP